MFSQFQSKLPTIIYCFLFTLAFYFVFAILFSKNSIQYSYALKNEMELLENKLNQINLVNEDLNKEIKLWKTHPEAMKQEYLTSKFAINSARGKNQYFDYENK